jgi:AraC family transcriptional regulator, transcriptional activator of pobA
MKSRKAEIPICGLADFRHVHRVPDDKSEFGYNSLPRSQYVAGFELYSSHGLVGSVGPLRSVFYRISLTVTGGLDMQIGLEHYRHEPRTLGFTFPNQLFFKNNISADASGYYMFFDEGFLADLLPAARLPEEFPFLSMTGVPLFRVSEAELAALVEIVGKMDVEVRQERPERAKALQLYLYLFLLDAKRSYQRQGLDKPSAMSQAVVPALAGRFQKLVGVHFLSVRRVADYAAMLAVSANHLNKVVKEMTGKTASESISEMLAQEAKALLRYTDLSIAEIAYQLDFSDPASFNRFFKGGTAETPLAWRKRHAAVSNA